MVVRPPEGLSDPEGYQDYSLEFRPHLGPNRCKFFSQTTGELYIAHDLVLVAADDDDEFDPSWLGPTVNLLHYGYCRRCGQPFKWNSDPSVATWGWHEISKEQVTADFEAAVQYVKDRGLEILTELRSEGP